MKFEVGDRVNCTSSTSNDKYGCGTIVRVDGDHYNVALDEYPQNQYLNRCLFFFEHELTLMMYEDFQDKIRDRMT